jgi:hypothetical protein
MSALRCGSAGHGMGRRDNRQPHCCLIATLTDLCVSTALAWRKYAALLYTLKYITI